MRGMLRMMPHGLGVPTNAFVDGADAPVVAAVEEAAKVLAARGARIVRLKLPLMA